MKVCFTLFLLLLCLGAQAQNDMATLTLKFNKQGRETVYLKYGNDVNKPIKLDGKGEYTERLYVDTGYYTLVNNSDVLRIYLEPGMNLEISRQSKKDTVYVFAGKGSEENLFLSEVASAQARCLPIKWGVLTDKVNDIEPKDFLTRLDQYKAVDAKMLGDHHFSTAFNSLQTAYVDCLSRVYALQYMNDYGLDVKAKKDYIKRVTNGDPALASRESKAAALKALHIKELTYDDRRAVFANVYKGFEVNNELLFKCLPEYSGLVEQQIEYMARTRAGGGGTVAERKIEHAKNDISNLYIKQALLMKFDPPLSVAVSLAPSEGLDGTYAPDFSYYDVNNKRVSLSSMKGSYVYIDVWATWCGPCKREIPALDEVEKKFEGQNIKFVSVSIDKSDDKYKWQSFVADNHLGGIQVMADNDWNSAFTRRLNINSIPRFILVDPNGNIISANAKRPSSRVLTSVLEKLLGAKAVTPTPN